MTPIKVFSGILLTLLAFIPSMARADIELIAGWDGQLFPSYIISTAAARFGDEQVDPRRLGDPRGLLGVKVVAPTANAPVTVTVSSEDLLEPSSYSGTLSEQGAAYSVFPKIKYRYDRLAEIDQAKPVSVTFRVELAGATHEEQTAVITVRSVNDCPLRYIDGNQQIHDVSFTFAAYTNEQHPFVDKLLREALELGVVDQFTGYQTGTRNEVVRQVYAIWDALAARDVRYSSVTATAAASDVVSSQHVRLLDQSLNNKQANCVDGAVLFASMLRKIEIRPFLVVVPGHCYVGFYLDETNDVPLVLETTLLGTKLDGNLEVPDVLDDLVSPEVRHDYSWSNFVTAVCLAQDEFQKNQQKLQDPNQRDYQLIDIATARKTGILPIAHRGKEQFERNSIEWTNADEDGDGSAAEPESTQSDDTVVTEDRESVEPSNEDDEEEIEDGETDDDTEGDETEDDEDEDEVEDDEDEEDLENEDAS